MNRGITTVADMGYIMYTYAYHSDYWYYDAYQRYTVLNGCVLADENRFSYRKDQNIHYKQNRREHRNCETHIIARKFWKDQRKSGKDNGLEILSMYGAEGDDIVALLVLQYGLQVIGVDKDYYQLPNLDMISTQGVQQGIRVDRLPKTLQHLNWNSTLWLLHLAINGDISDNVPRLTEKGKRGLALEATILTDDNPFTTAYTVFGDDFLSNLYEVILPYPMLIDAAITPYDVYTLCATGEWYNYVRHNGNRIALPDVWNLYGGDYAII